MCIFFIILLGFIMSFHMAFGGDVEEFRSPVDAGYTLFLMINGDFTYYNLQKSNRVLAPLFMLSFLFLVITVLVNMFVAIVSASYASAVDDLANSTDDFLSSSLKLFFRDVRMKYLGWLLGRNNKLHKVQRLLTAIAGLQSITEQQKDEVRSLRREIDHDINNDGLLSKIIKEFPNKPDIVPIQTKDFAHLRRSLPPPSYLAPPPLLHVQLDRSFGQWMGFWEG